MSRLLARFQAPTMQNTGSTARDHLASERTFLSWLRTGLGFIALGMGVERFSRLEAASPADLPNSPKTSRYGTSDATRARRELENTKMKKQTDQEHEQLLVTTLLGTGTACIGYGASRYFTNLNLMTRGLFKPAYHGAAVLSITVAAIAGAAWLNLAADERERSEALRTDAH